MINSPCLSLEILRGATQRKVIKILLEKVVEHYYLYYFFRILEYVLIRRVNGIPLTEGVALLIQ